MYEPYRTVADALQLRMTPADPGLMTFFIDLDGEVDGHPLRIRRVVGRAGFLVVESRWPVSLGAGLQVTSAGLLDVIATLLGGQDLEVGERRFDKAFRVRAIDPKRARAVMTPELCEALLACDGDVALTDESVSVRHSHRAESTELLLACSREMTRIARLVQAGTYR